MVENGGQEVGTRAYERKEVTADMIEYASEKRGQV